MSSDAGEYDVPSNRLRRYRHRWEDLDAGFNFLPKRPSETFISPFLGCDKTHLETGSNRRGDYPTELISNSFPALPNVSPFPVSSAQNTAGIWSHSNVQQLVARISVAEAKVKRPSTQKARQTDPFPQLIAETPLPHLSMEARDKWASFRIPPNGDRAEGSHAMCLDSGDRLDEGRKRKARSKKSWQPLEL